MMLKTEGNGRSPTPEPVMSPADAPVPPTSKKGLDGEEEGGVATVPRG